MNARNSRGQSRGQSGVALVEVMIGFGLAAIIMIGMAGFFNSQNKSIQGVKVTQVRDTIATLLARFAADTTVLTASANWTPGSADWPTNDGVGDLKDCWIGVAGHTCANGTERGFTLVDSFGAQIAGPGQNANPRYDGTTALYAQDGTICGSSNSVNPDSEKCPLVVYTTFIPRCAGGACAVGVPAQSLQINFHIRQGNTAFPVTLGAGRLKPFQGSVSLMVPSSSGFPLTSCPGGMSRIGAGRGFFCIHTATQGPANWDSAARNGGGSCLSNGYTLCSSSQLMRACAAGISLASVHWTGNTPANSTDHAVTIGGAANCTNNGTDLVTSSHDYRCCTR